MVSAEALIGHLQYHADLGIVSNRTCRELAKLVAAALGECGLCSGMSIPDS